jgi:DNA-binding GntR family transcriptional regulator
VGPIAPPIDPHSPIPKYSQLREILPELIESELAPAARIPAGGAGSSDARLLGLPVGAPVLEFQRTSFAGEQPAEFVVSTYRGDRYEFRVALDAPTRAHPQGGIA